MKIFLFIIITAIFGWTQFLPASTWAENGSMTEHQAKTAFLFNVIRYASWPRNAYPESEPFAVGILGDNSSESSWNALKGKQIHGRIITVTRSRDLDDLRNCQVIFIETSEKKQLARIIKQLHDEPVLTVSDMDGFYKNGGMVNLIIANNRIKVAVNLKSARTAGIDISSQLLKLATEVIQ